MSDRVDSLTHCSVKYVFMSKHMFTNWILFSSYATLFMLFFPRKISLVAQILGFAKSACNPFVYCIFSQKFRDGFKEVCCRRKSDVKRNTSAIETKRPREQSSPRQDMEA